MVLRLNPDLSSYIEDAFVSLLAFADDGGSVSPHELVSEVCDPRRVGLDFVVDRLGGHEFRKDNPFVGGQDRGVHLLEIKVGPSILGELFIVKVAGAHIIQVVAHIISMVYIFPSVVYAPTGVEDDRPRLRPLYGPNIASCGLGYRQVDIFFSFGSNLYQFFRAIDPLLGCGSFSEPDVVEVNIGIVGYIWLQRSASGGDLDGGYRPFHGVGVFKVCCGALAMDGPCCGVGVHVTGPRGCKSA